MWSRPKRAAVLVPAIVILLAGGLRFWGLSFPPDLYWDEQYYVFDAEVYLGGGIGQPVGDPPAVKIADEGTWIHPPLGKWIIALLGVGPLGLRSIGWRLPSALFGTAGVALLYFLALELWGSVWWAGLAALLLALDGLHIVQSRMAMLDIFLTTFITAGDAAPRARSQAHEDGESQPGRPGGTRRAHLRIALPPGRGPRAWCRRGDQMGGCLRAHLRRGTLHRLGDEST